MSTQLGRICLIRRPLCTLSANWVGQNRIRWRAIWWTCSILSKQTIYASSIEVRSLKFKIWEALSTICLAWSWTLHTCWMTFHTFLFSILNSPIESIRTRLTRTIIDKETLTFQTSICSNITLKTPINTLILHKLNITNIEHLKNTWRCNSNQQVSV